MREKINDGGPAFPADRTVWVTGMTKRDYFAAQAMQGFAADPGVAWPNGIAGMAACAYQWADAMLQARNPA